jgi:acetyl-CoA decarbonylase/synthase complex subunit alpha
MEEKYYITLGRTKVDLRKVVKDIRGIEEMLREVFEGDWSENRYNQFLPQLVPFARAEDLFEWDQIILERHPFLYSSSQSRCELCHLGPCDLKEAKGVCGLDGSTFLAKSALLRISRGCINQMSISRNLLDCAKRLFGSHKRVTMGRNLTMADFAPSIATLTGLYVKSLEDLDRALIYGESQLVEILTAVSGGTDSRLSLEAKILHLGSLLCLAMDVSEIVKISCFQFMTAGNKKMEELTDFPPPVLEGGLGSIDQSKPVITFVGDDFLPAWWAVQYLREKNLEDHLEICGIGTVGLDIPHFYSRGKVLTNMIQLRKAIKSNISDVLVFGDGCFHQDWLPDAERASTKVIVTNHQTSLGFEDMTDLTVEEIIRKLLEGEQGARIGDPRKAAEVAIRLAQGLKRERDFRLSDEEMKKYIDRCSRCDRCFSVCPCSLDIGGAIMAGKEGLFELYKKSSFCGRCESVCPEGIPILDLMAKVGSERSKEDRFLMRAGRGPIAEVEVRAQAFSVTFGNTPGVVAVLGCGDAGSPDDLGMIAKELVARNCIVFTAGCGSIDIGRHFDEKEGKFIFQQYGSAALARNLINCGGCSSQVHIIDEFFKVARLGGAVSHYANFIETADYTYNRINYFIIMWGVLPERMQTLALGFARGGIPVILGPASGFQFDAYMLGNQHDRSKWWMYDGISGRKREVEPGPQHLIIPVETKEEALTMASKLLMRPLDLRDSRLSNIETYIDFHRKFFGDYPTDWPLYVRSEQELPPRSRAKLLKILKENYGWVIEGHRAKKAKHRDGRLLDIETYVREYGIEQGHYATCVQKLVVKKGEAK